MILASVPWGLTAREFLLACLGFFAIFMASLVTIVWVIASAWRDRGIARFSARAPESTPEPVRPDQHPPLQRPRSREPRSRVPQRPVPSWTPDFRLPLQGLSLESIPSGVAASSPPKDAATEEPDPPVDRISAAADRNADRTRLDLNPGTPTEEE